jgi:hypothetical protein
MRVRRCAEYMFVLVSSAPVKALENATGGDPDGIYPHGRVPYARLRAWQLRRGIDGQNALSNAI